jgi:hypothetical protein
MARAIVHFAGIHITSVVTIIVPTITVRIITVAIAISIWVVAVAIAPRVTPAQANGNHHPTV